MIRVKRLYAAVEFAGRTEFVETPEIAFYKIIFKRLKNIVCIRKKAACEGCEYSSTCLYFYLSGREFAEYDMVPVIIKRGLFSSTRFEGGTCWHLNFIFLGEACSHIDFFSYIIEDVGLKGLFGGKYRYFVRQMKVESMEKAATWPDAISGIKVITPFKGEENIFPGEYERLVRLNRRHGMTDESLDFQLPLFACFFKNFGERHKISIGTRKIKYKGKVGFIKFEEKIKMNTFFKLLSFTGMGELYALGGGCIEFITSDSVNNTNTQHGKVLLQGAGFK